VWATTVADLPGETMLGRTEREGTNDYATIHLEQRGDDVDQVTLFTAWRHELGHAMGLEHSTDRHSVMFHESFPADQSITDADAAIITSRMEADRAL
jgi:predicted Zn-dependent protease